MEEHLFHGYDVKQLFQFWREWSRYLNKQSRGEALSLREIEGVNRDVEFLDARYDGRYVEVGLNILKNHMAMKVGLPLSAGYMEVMSTALTRDYAANADDAELEAAALLSVHEIRDDETHPDADYSRLMNRSLNPSVATHDEMDAGRLRVLYKREKQVKTIMGTAGMSLLEQIIHHVKGRVEEARWPLQAVSVRPQVDSEVPGRKYVELTLHFDAPSEQAWNLRHSVGNWLDGQRPGMSKEQLTVLYDKLFLTETSTSY